MRHVELNIRLVTLLAAVAVAVVAVASLAPAPRQAAAGVGITSPEGILCFELTGLATGIGLVRIDHNTATDDVTFTSQVYIQTTGLVPTCQSPQDPMPDDAVAFPAPDSTRTSLPGTWDNGSDTLLATLCQANLNFAGLEFEFAKVTVNFALVTPPSKATGTFVLAGPYTDENCNVEDTGFNTFNVDVEGALFLDGPDGDPSTFNSDVDKDGIRDWDELAAGLPSCSDPFSDANCGVGGIAELPAVAGTSPAAAASSDNSAGLIAAAAAATAAGALALGSAARYARRRIR